MNPWKTLNIEPTDDKKAIKKAYAVLIKQYKPDEYPEKFQEIQSAYKMALSMQQWQQQQSDIDTKRPKQHQTVKHDSQKTNESSLAKSALELNDKALVEQQKYEEEQEQLVENLFKQLHQMAFSPLVVKSKDDNWKFIENYYKIDDLTLKPQVAREVFKKVAEYNVFQMRANKTLLIQPKVLLFLNGIFNWDTLWEDYQVIFPDIYFEVTFHYFENQYLENYDRSLLDSNSFILTRLVSLLIDVMFGFIYTLIFVIISYNFIDYQNTRHVYLGLMFIFIYIIISFLIEYLSIEKASLGKSILNLVITDSFGNQASKIHIIKRHIISNIMLIPFLFLPTIGLFATTFNYILLSSCLMLFAFFLFTKNSLPQDYLTNTFVIRKEKKKSHYFDYEVEESARSR